MNLLYIPLYIFGVTLLWQYIALRVDKLTGRKILRPTTIIDFGVKYANIFWYHVGRLTARISSFYIYLGFGDLLEALGQLISSTMSLFGSFYQFIKGYVSMYPLYQKPRLLVWGTVTLTLAIVGGISWYFDLWHYSTFNTIIPTDSWLNGSLFGFHNLIWVMLTFLMVGSIMINLYYSTAEKIKEKSRNRNSQKN
ncbi:Hypothetical protein HVR_LOCUS530 [uncultured virus]|nr:Hypothetical protein HVR_LOCUS530 [uncultured virus]